MKMFQADGVYQPFTYDQVANNEADGWKMWVI